MNALLKAATQRPSFVWPFDVAGFAQWVLTAIFIGLSFLLSCPAFDTVHIGRSYSAFAAIGSDAYWAHRSIIVAAFGLIGVVWPAPPVRALSITILSFAIGYVGVLFWVGDHGNSAIVVYGVLHVGGLWALLRLARGNLR